MRKQVAVVLTLACLSTACDRKPAYEQTVTGFLDALKSNDVEKAKTFFDGDIQSDLLSELPYNESLRNTTKTVWSTLKYEVLPTPERSQMDSFSVNVKVSTVDTTRVMLNYASAFPGNEMSHKFYELLSADDAPRKEEVVGISVFKTPKGYKIYPGKELDTVLLGGMTSR